MSDARRGLRRDLRAQRRAIPPAGRIAAAESLAERILALPFLPREGDVAGYWAMDGEIALHVLQLRLPRLLRYCLPVLADENQRLRQQQEQLAGERALLLAKNEQARSRVEAMIARLKSLEQHT